VGAGFVPYPPKNDLTVVKIGTHPVNNPPNLNTKFENNHKLLAVVSGQDAKPKEFLTLSGDTITRISTLPYTFRDI
jgi:hypothetical protein